MSLQNLREKIVNEIPISELISRYGINLTRKPSGYVGVCPFHGDTNPSMSVSDDKRIYKCFACGAGTTHFDFVMNLHNLSFVEALKDISEKFGIDFESFTEKTEKSQKVIYAEKILKASSEVFYKIGQSSCEPFKEFVQQRNLSQEIVELYKLGFAPKKNTVIDYISSLPKKAQDEVLAVSQEIGLIKYSDRNKSQYDTFRDRIIFPIWDHYGKVIGYTSRSIHKDQMPKYLNSGESFIFNKRNLLYGLHLAKPFIRKRDAVILVEGNMDQITMFRKGYEHSVAIMGTALGDNSLRALKSLTHNVYLGLDGDDAGFNASVRINKQLLQNGIIPNYIDFAPHKDPDDFLNNEGAVALQNRIDDSKAFIDVLFEKLLPETGLDIVDTKLKILDQAFEIVAPLKTDLRATERLMKWAQKLGLKSASEKIIESYENFLGNNREYPTAAPQPTDEEARIHEEMMAFNEQELYAREVPNGPETLSKVEETLIIALIEHPDCLEHEQMSDLLDFMGSDRVKQYILKLREIIFEIDQKEFKNFAVNIAKEFGLEDVALKGVNKSQDFSIEKDTAKKILIDLEKKLIKETLKEKKELLKTKRQYVQTEEELSQLLMEIHQIEKKLYSLNNPKGPL
ncbi:DNA primase [Bacteriovorax sp. Seq25_V]|uniref:DNA primase n=1 Tax=Bacteriovorax sp. Seq25_V TaxID=1201288 RepID=UPI00038A2E7A|nr:DNA primase [Bacteriovorax sp. Seq25_V]EQC44796.1 DNA primase [Bacteriovorax sp. Seq25_V]